jgi:hypothetical protein
MLSFPKFSLSLQPKWVYCNPLNIMKNKCKNSLEMKHYTHNNTLSSLLGSHKYTALAVVAIIFALTALPLTGWGQTLYSNSNMTATGGTSGVSGQNYDKLVDGNSSTKWCVISLGNPTYIEFNSAALITPVSYILTTGEDTQTYSGRNPISWTVKAKANSSDGWTTLDTQTNNYTLEALNSTSYEFSITNSTAYQYFRFEVQSTGGSEFQLIEFQFKVIPNGSESSDDFQIGTGTNTSSSGNGNTVKGSPMGNTYYYYSTAQFIFTNSEMGGAKTLKSIKFYHNGYFFTSTVRIYLTHTLYTNFSDLSPVTDATLVYTGTDITVGGSAGWQEFLFDTPFEYNGTSNLVVIVCRGDSSGYNSSQTWYYTSELSDRCYIYRSSDTSGYDDIENTEYSYGTSQTNRPSTIFTYTTGLVSSTTIPTVTTTSGATAAETTASCSGNVTSTGNSSITERGICYRVAGTGDVTASDSHVTYSNGTGSYNVTLTGLTPGTTYRYRAYAKNSQGTAYGTTYTFTTTSNDYLMNSTNNGQTITTCSGYFYDEGGPSSNYSTNYADWTMTFQPGTSGKMIRVQFTSYTVESTTSEYDYLQIYNGTSTSAPQIGGNYLTSPGTVTASNCDGALTFRWKTDVSGNAAGWAATISCVDPATATLNFSASPSGGGTVSVTSCGSNISSGSSVMQGSTCNISATPNSGYVFTGWSFSGTGASVANTSSNSTTLTMGTATTTLTANFTRVYTLTWSNPTGGTISVTQGGNPVTSGGYFAPGTEFDISVTPNSGYVFSSWSVSGTGSSIANGNSSSTTLTMGTANTTLYAQLASPPTAVTMTCGTNYSGTVGTAGVWLTYNGDPNEWEEPGQEKMYSFTPTISGDYIFSGEKTDGDGDPDFFLMSTPNNTGTCFASWNDETATTVSLTGGTTYYLIVDNYSNEYTADYTVSVACMSNIVATASPSAGGSITGAGYYSDGTECTLEATPNEGYVFYNWTEGGSEVSTDDSYTFTVSGDRTLVANFKLDKDLISVSGTTTISCGDNTELTASGLSGVIYNWYSDAECTNLVHTGETYTTPVLSNTTTYYVKAVESSLVEGLVSTFGYEGSERTYSVPSGYSFLKLEVWGAQGGNAGSYSGGKGGYSVGTLSSPSGTLYVCVGGQGTSDSNAGDATLLPGGWNGGGAGRGWGSSSHNGAGGGGATHIANAAPSSGSDYQLRYYSSNQSNVLLIAGGGGGGSDEGNGGAGGGTEGIKGSGSHGCDPGTQLSGSAWGYATDCSYTGGECGGGGGGYYGGFSATNENYAGGGGSGYLNRSLTDAETIDGNNTMPNPSGGTVTGREGNGYARITPYNIVLGCESAAKAVTVTVNSISADDITIDGTTTISSGGSTTLIAGGISGASYKWYSDEGCTNLVHDGETFPISTLTSSTTYYVKAEKEVGVYEGTPTTFGYEGSERTYSIPSNAVAVKMEVWGAQGGTTNGGKGGYSEGKMAVTTGDVLYVYVGEEGRTLSSGTNTLIPTSFNGGGSGGIGSSYYNNGSGGGGTDVRVNSNSLYARVIVAGGGGGGGKNSSGTGSGGVGGGTSGTAGQYQSAANTTRAGQGGTQTAGGATGTESSSYGTAGSFGTGGSMTAATPWTGGGGGGGWYGGGSSTGNGAAGGGGSGYIYTASTASNYPSGCLLNSSYYLTDAQTIAGNATMPNPSGGTMTGREGDGYARITPYYQGVCETEPKPVTVTVQCTLSVSTSPSGSGFTASGGGTYNAGTSRTVTASTSNTNYVFAFWKNGSTVVSTNSSYTFTLSSNTNLVAYFAPLQISNATEWGYFCDAVNGGFDYSGQTVTMTDNVGTVSTMAGTTTKPFRGTFDGQCNELTVSISSSEQGAAPFHVIEGATIENLIVKGSVTATAHHAGGLVGFTEYTGVSYSSAPANVFDTIRNCRVETNVTNNGGSNNYIGGIIGHNKCARTTIIGCVYTGTLTSSGYKGGMIGWSDRSKLTVKDSYFVGNHSTSNNFSPIGCKAQTQDGSNITLDLTFSNFYYNKDAGSFGDGYYNAMYSATPVGTAKHAYTITAGHCITVARSGDATSYSCSGITAYTNGIVYDGTILGGDGDAITLNLGYDVGSTVTPSAPTLNGYTSTSGSLGSGTHTGTNDAYTLTMAASNAVINAEVSCSAYTVTTSTPWTENFTWDGHGETKARLFDAYPDNCWYVPNTITVTGGYTTSPRLWVESSDPCPWLSMKSNGASGDAQIVVLPEFTNPINTLRISFKAHLASSGSRTLEVGWYNMDNGTFTKLEDVTLNTTSFTSYGPYALSNGPSAYNSDYRIALRFPASAEISCNVDDVVVDMGGYVVTVNTASGGSGTYSFTGAGVLGYTANTARVEPNGTITITTAGATGYTFNYMSDDDDSDNVVMRSPDRSFTIAEVTSSRNFTAHFSQQGSAGVGRTSWVTAIDAIGDVPSGGFDISSGNATISNKEGLAYLINMVNGLNDQEGAACDFSGHSVTLTADVDMSDHDWVPIGTTEHPFRGTFDGNGHTISGITRSTEFPHQGLFGYTEGATIQNVIVSANISGNSYTMGAIVGTLASSSAKTTPGTVAFTEATGSITGTALTTAIGGLVGSNEGGTVHSSFAVNTLTAAVNTTYVGGLVGSNSGGVQNAYSRAILSGSYGLKGGLVGNNTASVENCYVVLDEQSFPAFAYHNTDDGLKYCYADKNTTYVTAGQTSPTGHGYFGAVQSSIKHLDYMYRDNAVTIVSGDTIFATTGYDTDFHTPKWNGLVSALNQGRRDGQAQWYRPLTTAINGDLPVLGFPMDNALATLNSDGKYLQYGSNQNGSNGIDALLTAYNNVDPNDLTNPASIFHYGKASGVTGVPAGNVHVYINEDAVLLQTTSSPNPFINTTVGITFDNSDHGQNAFDFWGNQLKYDWHLMSTPLSGLKTGAVHGSYVAGDPNVVDITSIGGYFPNGLITGGNPAVGGAIKWDFYSYYEPAYHWINLKRNKNNHYHQDGGALIEYNEADQDTDRSSAYYIPGKGYMMAINQNTFMNATGTLNRGNVSITLTKKEPDGINYQPGANLVGNPYQGYLNLAKITDKYSGLDKFYIYDADQGVYAPVVDGSSSNPVIPSKYIHPHQAFFVLAPSDDMTLEFEPTMAGTTMGSGSNSHFRDEEQPDYPLVNLFAEDMMGHRDLTVIEFHRPELGGAEKINYMHNAPFVVAAHHDRTSYGILFATDDLERIPVRFQTTERGTITMKWSTYNGEFYELRLIDNKLGVDYNMLANDSYTFEASPEDYSSRFYIVYDCSGTDIDENEDDSSAGSGSFAYIGVDGNIIIDAESYEDVSLQMIDMMGRVLYSTTVNGEMHTLSTNGLAKGVYLIRLANNKNVRIQKIVVK